jgi:hypothetical protein
VKFDRIIIIIFTLRYQLNVIFPTTHRPVGLNFPSICINVP